MSDLYSLSWLILAVIGGVAACKVTYLVWQDRHTSVSNHTDSTVRTTAVNPRRSENETGPMVYYADNPHGRRDCEYRFNYKRENGSWRAYIVRMPSLCGRSGDLHTTHRFTDNRGRYWVCWDTPVTSLKDMQTISRVWANSIQEYIATGKKFG